MRESIGSSPDGIVYTILGVTCEAAFIINEEHHKGAMLMDKQETVYGWLKTAVPTTGWLFGGEFQGTKFYVIREDGKFVVYRR